ncbi:fungal-specific transcription factor domain-containing protein [Crassisporium funariophilum]|nr:fungal-specific transcription factor domain-containing protein [Crassisporium funariophilum]
MPAEPTKAKLKRRSSRKDLEEYRYDGSHGRELELKRNREEVSCAECRRLKIKCDKQIPCQSCQRRGCAALCPNGSLATGQGTRFVLAATEHLHRRISKLSGRIRQLEDALSSLHAKHSTEPHPLLHEDLIHTDERDGEGDGEAEEGAGPPTQQGEVIDAFGTLSISEHGISRFFGPTGGSESLLLANLESNHASPESIHTPGSLRDSKSPSTIGDLSLFSQSFPFTPMGQPADVQELVESHLPTFERTLTLCETYFEQVAWIFRGVTRMQLMDDMLPVIFKRQSSPAGEDYSGPHDLALLFVILAIGALVGQEPSNALGEHFHQISRAAISLQPVLEKPSIVTIQTLHLMSIYNAMSGSDLKSETSMEMTWSLITLASHLSQTIGLHRDSARWGLTPKMVQRRRILFWDLFVADVWQSLNTGRPPSFSLAYIDCSFPQYDNEDKLKEVGIWQCRFAAECVAEVTSRTLTAEAPSYATIMELDRKVREFPLPEGISSSSDDLGASFQRCVLDHIRETVLMYIHRSFFAQAIIEHPINPLKSHYAPSFLAAYRASSTILKSIREQFNMWPNSCSRFWTMWTFAFTAAVVFGTVVTRGPRSPLAQSAMAELEQACILFTKASVYSIRAMKALPVLTRLSEKARYALAAAQNDTSPMQGDNGGLLWNIKQEDTDDELSIFAGRTRFVSTKRGVDSATTSPPRSVPMEPSPPLYSAIPPHQQQSVQEPPEPSHPVPYVSEQMSSNSTSLYHHGPRLASSASGSSTSSVADSWGPPPPPHSSKEYTQGLPMEEEPSMHYNYVSSERTHQQSHPLEASHATYGWSNDPRLHEIHRQPRAMQTQAAASASTDHFESQQIHIAQPQHQQHPQYPPRSSHVNTMGVQQQQAPHRNSHYAAAHYHSHTHPQPHPHVNAHLPQQPQHSQQQNVQPQTQYPMYATAPAAPGYQPYAQPRPGAPPNIDLADLGLASRDSRLDERWSSFMADSGLLEDLRRR